MRKRKPGARKRAELMDEVPSQGEEREEIYNKSARPSD